jgi:formamidopyrimidine-DNA glycosylase
MPEYPDVTIYIESLRQRIVGNPLQKIRLTSPFVLRSVEPPLHDAEGKRILDLRRIGKQIVWHLENEIYMVFHLMVAGRFHWKKSGAKAAGKIGLAAFDFSGGTLLLTEASSKKRASLHLVKGASGLAQFDKGGIEVFDSSFEDFDRVLRREHHTLKRALTDPRLFSAIGNAYSDEILHRARLSPLLLTHKLTGEQSRTLFHCVRETLDGWVNRLREQTGKDFPEKVTAFHDEMAVHGKFGKSCPLCGTKIQRIVYAENECNYCPKCQTGGKLLADRSLSRLLKDDWPKTIDEL